MSSNEHPTVLPHTAFGVECASFLPGQKQEVLSVESLERPHDHVRPDIPLHGHALAQRVRARRVVQHARGTAAALQKLRVIVCTQEDQSEQEARETSRIEILPKRGCVRCARETDALAPKARVGLLLRAA